MLQTLRRLDQIVLLGRVMHARAVAIDAGAVKVGDGSHIPADALIMATGSHYAAPLKPRGAALANFTAALEQFAVQIESIAHTVIVGAAAVGV